MNIGGCWYVSRDRVVKIVENDLMHNGADVLNSLYTATFRIIIIINGIENIYLAENSARWWLRSVCIYIEKNTCNNKVGGNVVYTKMLYARFRDMSLLIKSNVINIISGSWQTCITNFYMTEGIHRLIYNQYIFI